MIRGCHVTRKRDMHTEIWFQLFARLYHFVDQHGAKNRTRLDLERMLTAMRNLSRQEAEVAFFSEANILSMLPADFCSEGA
jgi:hypothetical protein